MFLYEEDTVGQKVPDTWLLQRGGTGRSVFGSLVAVLFPEELSKAFKSVAKQHGVQESTVRDKCTRQLGVDTEQFRGLFQGKNHFITFSKERYPQYDKLIDEKLA